ncbi:MAG TPA: alanine--glyoxylate aminotransferase family protein [Vicinamibacterales bacterium]|jgi:alanine-glyoxylate transaminase/serine-glyoxylate transaminase/serine-pyruvate transaminase|nr:alanine--glyoxylate aminotransferase family protein [Vicinamibacterales bacterium]
MVPAVERLLLGPGPSPVAPRVQRAMSAPILSHLDPALMSILDRVRLQLRDAFGGADDAFACAVSGTGTAGMEAAVANVTRSGRRATVVVNGYFGDRLSQMFGRYGATVSRVEREWGRAADPDALDRALRARGADVVAMVHAETSTGVLNPVAELCAVAQRHGALTVVDAVTSLGAHAVATASWGCDVCYSCTQKGLGAPSGLAPIVFSRRAQDASATSGAAATFYFDLQLLKNYWIDRKYHHTISAPLIYALSESLDVVSEEGFEPRWRRHRGNHLRFARGLGELGLGLLPPDEERLWSLNAVVVPEGVDEARVRQRFLDERSIEIGAGLGPLAGRIWRVGLMGSGSTADNVDRLLDAYRSVLRPA